MCRSDQNKLEAAPELNTSHVKLKTACYWPIEKHKKIRLSVETSVLVEWREKLSIHYDV